MAGAAPAIEVEALSVAFGNLRAVDEASLRVEAGEIVALVGPSGSGKTTLLRAIAGLERPGAGIVRIGGREVVGPLTWVEPERRRVGMVFQEGALFPHITVERNVAFGAAGAGRAAELLELVGLSARAGSYVHELSGGERQRVALARALALDPAVVLLDEPFASLDAGLREALRGEVTRILREAGASALLVTHDQAEALSVADALAVLRDGRVQQTGAPEQVYRLPGSRWVAEFLGEANVLPGTAGGGIVECEIGRFPATPGIEGPVEVVIRPEAVAVDGAPANGRGGAEVVGRSFFGHDHLTHLRLPSGLRLRSRQLGPPPRAVGERVSIRVDAPVAVLPAPHGAAATAR
jgi:iron(III) transport system ATP-binding protein